MGRGQNMINKSIHCRTGMVLRTMAIAVCAVIMAASWAMAAPAANDAKKTIKLQVGPASSEIVEKIRPEIGARGTFITPFGSIKPNLGFGYGCALYFALTADGTGIFSLRPGVTSEFMYFDHKTSSVKANLIMLPEYAHIRFLLQWDFGLFLYPKVGCGATFGFLKKTEYGIKSFNKKSIDLTVVGGVGIGYNPPKVKNLVVFAEADYMMMFESLKGQFVTASVGIGYKF
jgi:hypothetical protein